MTGKFHNPNIVPIFYRGDDYNPMMVFNETVEKYFLGRTSNLLCNIQKNGSGLYFACMRGHADTVNLLIKHGAAADIHNDCLVSYFIIGS